VCPDLGVWESVVNNGLTDKGNVWQQKHLSLVSGVIMCSRCAVDYWLRKYDSYIAITPVTGCRLE
jgi:hypothetical protein